MAARSLRRAGVGVVAALLAATATGFALAALYLFALGYLGAILAAIVAAGGALVLAGLLMLGGLACRLWHQGGHHPSESSRSGGVGDMADIVTHFLRHNPKKAAMTALAAGLVLGVSPNLRRSLIRLGEDFVDTQLKD